MKLMEVISTYVVLKQSLGIKFEATGRLLRQFGRSMGDIDIDEVCSKEVAVFLRGTGQLSATWTLKYRVLSGFYQFAISRGHVDSSPLPVNRPKLPPPQSPHVYSTDELRRLIEATPTLHVSHSRQQAMTYRTLILVLYSTGMRIGEALGLTLQDVDLVQRIITVRKTKFYKTRLVPIGPKLAQELAGHIERRRQLPTPMDENSAVFTTRTGRPWPYQHVITLFQHLRRAADIDCPAGEPRPPRLHDLRHTAAVHRLVAWYRSGKDVQRLLPQLATYLGHADIRSTQAYLHITPELLREASQRFANYALQGDSHG
ncbi:MAG: tyrosine-type recombinase/integrase [Pseudomonadota bacterium]